MGRGGASRPGAQWWLPEQPSFELIEAGLSACGGCELSAEAVCGCPVAGHGPLRPPLMLVADARGAGGAPYDSPAWRLVDRALRRGGLKPDDVYRTHLVKHPHPAECGAEDGSEQQHCPHAAACLPWLWTEVDTAEPDAVVLVGHLATGAVRDADGPAPGVRDDGGDLPWPRASLRWAGARRSWAPRRCVSLGDPPVDGSPGQQEAWVGRLATLAHVHGRQDRR